VAVGGDKSAALAGRLDDGMIATDAESELIARFDSEDRPLTR
jgi:hypothetical protein